MNAAGRNERKAGSIATPAVHWPARLATAFLMAALGSAPAVSFGSAAAGERDGKPPVNALQPTGISLDEAVALVQRRYDAKVVKAETVRQRGRVMHRIRLLSSDGRVWTVTVDALSGDMR